MGTLWMFDCCLGHCFPLYLQRRQVFWQSCLCNSDNALRLPDNFTCPRSYITWIQRRSCLLYLSRLRKTQTIQCESNYWICLTYILFPVSNCSKHVQVYMHILFSGLGRSMYSNILFTGSCLGCNHYHGQL